MATQVQHTQKDFLLKLVYDEQLPLIYLHNRIEYALILEKPARTELSLRISRFMPFLKVREKMSLMFDFRGQMMSFTVEINAIQNESVITTIPESVYRNLNRSFSRVAAPADLEVQFTFMEDHYSLIYPRVTDYEDVEQNELMGKMGDLRNLSGLIAQLAAWIKGCADGHRLVLFKDSVQPDTTEERIITETGKSLYLPDVRHGLPTEDPYPRRRIITTDLFKRYMESTGVDADSLDVAYNRFVKGKEDMGFRSEVWVPLLFKAYVIGYIHLWVTHEGGRPPFDFKSLDSLYQFAKILVFSLKENGYFDMGRLKNNPFSGEVIDISASGLLFVCSQSPLSSLLVQANELAIRFITPQRVITTNARIVRRYEDRNLKYFGYHFGTMEPNDLSYFFEFIYGKPFTEADARFLATQV